MIFKDWNFSFTKVFRLSSGQKLNNLGSSVKFLKFLTSSMRLKVCVSRHLHVLEVLSSSVLSWLFALGVVLKDVSPVSGLLHSPYLPTSDSHLWPVSADVYFITDDFLFYELLYDICFERCYIIKVCLISDREHNRVLSLGFLIFYHFYNV